MVKLYKVFADYRPKDTVKKHYYYVYGENRVEVKQKFSRWFPWLKVYEVVECADDERKEKEEYYARCGGIMK